MTPEISYVTHKFNPVSREGVLILAIVITLIGAIVSAFASGGKTSLQICQESYMKSSNEIVRYNEENPSYKISLPQYDCNSIVWTASGAIVPPPSETLRNKFGLWDCRFITDEHKLPRYNLEWTAYDIACEKGKSFDVKSPSSYTIEKIGFWYNIGNYIILKNSKDSNIRLVLGHTVTSRKVWTTVEGWEIIGQTNLSGESTWVHVHIELWYKYFIVSRWFALGTEYDSQNGTALLNHRHWDFSQPTTNPYYFTSYDLWDPAQNDSTPCIGASWKDLCEMEKNWIRTMALTSDIRNLLWVKFWDKIELIWEDGCQGIYQVEDEMNVRYRSVPWILRPWTPYYIKWDLPSKWGGACNIQKIKW